MLTVAEPGGYVMWFEFDTTELKVLGATPETNHDEISKVTNELKSDGEE